MFCRKQLAAVDWALYGGVHWSVTAACAKQSVTLAGLLWFCERLSSPLLLVSLLYKRWSSLCNSIRRKPSPVVNISPFCLVTPDAKGCDVLRTSVLTFVLLQSILRSGDIRPGDNPSIKILPRRWRPWVKITPGGSESGVRISASFYRAMLCIGADYAVARCSSVCPSVARRYCVKTAKHSVSIMSYTKPYGNIPSGTRLTRASNAGGMKNSDFRPVSSLSRKWYKIGTYTMERQQRKPIFNRLNGAIASYLEWLSEVFINTKRRAAGLRQLSYLY